LQSSQHGCDIAAPLLLAQAVQRRLAYTVFICLAGLVGQVGKFHRLELAVDDER
jgi:hypothetical protein